MRGQRDFVWWGIFGVVLGLLSSLLTGCPAPKPEPGPIPATLCYLGDVSANLALASLVAEPPDSKPLPAGVCPQCRGTGKVGDGVVFVTCNECGGDGRIGSDEIPAVMSDLEVFEGALPDPEEEPAEEVPMQESSAATTHDPIRIPVVRYGNQQCQGGSCNTSQKRAPLMGFFRRQ